MGVLKAGSHLPRAAMRLLMERILAMVHHGARLVDIKMLLLMMGQLLPVMLLLLVHGLMGCQGVVMRKLGDRRAVH